eukprot:gb/GECG01003688.1/.p1 GENE.gb/GECG01003688.1/~~gb/GECG01003688.1/.p1  ORF type:complete len:512 (+),score=81.90 gb/GECG01003688.1/:1-1536(+)
MQPARRATIRSGGSLKQQMSAASVIPSIMPFTPHTVVFSPAGLLEGSVQHVSVRWESSFSGNSERNQQEFTAEAASQHQYSFTEDEAEAQDGDSSAQDKVPREVENLHATDGTLIENNKQEVKDPYLIFDLAWRNLEKQYGLENMVFPKEVIWLSGAPGAGKGTISSFVMKERDLTAGPIETSALLTGPKFQQLKDEGKLIGDKDVVEAVMEALLQPEYSQGVIVDGYPRTMVQAQCIQLLYDKLRAVRYEYKDHPKLRKLFKRPIFHITVLYVDEEESVRRQLKRGTDLERHNRRVQETGVGKEKQMRATDISEDLARERYRIFKEQVYAALNSIKDHFHFHFIPADGSLEEVQEHVRREFIYQSSMELADETFDLVRSITPAKNIIKHARQNMVQRLNTYANDHRELFENVLQLIRDDFIHILQRQALAGRAIIRSNSPLLESKMAINMVLDVLGERGYHVALDVTKERIPDRVDVQVPGETGQKIHNRTVRTFIFHVEFPRPAIRREE